MIAVLTSYAMASQVSLFVKYEKALRFRNGTSKNKDESLRSQNVTNPQYVRKFFRYNFFESYICANLKLYLTFAQFDILSKYD